MRLLLVQPQLRHEAGADNLAAVRSCLDGAGISPSPDDVLLLPERVTLTHSRSEYVGAVVQLARELGCVVVGGSHHERRAAEQVNAGVAVAPDGSLLGEYEKVRPYANERAFVRGGARPGELSIHGRRFLVLICADFWFSDLFHQARHLPDVVLVPALSVSRKPAPDYSRALWRHLAIARAYEMGAFVGISDWGHPSALPLLSTSGVGGLADPTSLAPEDFFQPIGNGGARAYPLDFAALEQLRADRRDRGFFWKPE
jgi:predicted amidohydrolase